MKNFSDFKISRRNLLKIVGAGTIVTGLGINMIPDTAEAKNISPISADQSLAMLMKGNQQYVAKKLRHPNQTAARLTEIAKGQHPFAIILGCADSRVPPEIIFDQGLGDLFVIRVAGNIVDDAILGSIEYAAEHLGTPVLMVLGHERCGAVDATLKGGELPGHISRLAEAIKPAVDKVKGKPGDALDNAVRANVLMVVEQLKASTPILTALLEKGKLKIVGGRYDLDTGAVEIIA